MCNGQCIRFGEQSIIEGEIEGKRVLEVGSRDMNGSFRSIIMKFKPKEYIGVDIENGSCVDKICSIYDLVKEFGINSFDYVICTEVIEHLQGWQLAINNLKDVCSPKGYILITTRSKGFGYHSYPEDYWRYSLFDMMNIFSDFIIWKLENDSIDQAGVFVKVQKPDLWIRRNLFNISLHKMVKP